MSTTTKKIECVGCGALVPDLAPGGEPPNSSPGCYQIYGEVLTREYSDFRYAAVHNLTVDAYSLQHPGPPSSATIKSVAVHLVSLYLQLEKEFDSMTAARAKQAAAKHHQEFFWLEPPSPQESLTILDVQAAADPAAHKEVVSQWANSVWKAWATHHPTVRAWAVLSGLVS